MKHCSHCKGENRDQARFCGHCGRSFTAGTPEQPKRKARRHLRPREKVLVSFALGLLLGVLFRVPFFIERPAIGETLPVRRPKLSQVPPEVKATTAPPREESSVSSPWDVYVERGTIEDRIFQAVNRARYEHGAPPLLDNTRLQTVAHRHSEDMAARNFFDHINPDSQSPLDRVQVEGIDDFTHVGENLFSCKGCVDLAQAVVQGWLSSPGHRRNMLEPSFTEGSIGTARDASGTVYVTQVYLGKEGQTASLPGR
jgi:uncharacterized protein YkwD